MTFDPISRGFCAPKYGLALVALLVYFLASLYMSSFSAAERRHYFRSTILASVLMLILITGLRFGYDLRMYGFASTAESFQPLINAIKLYKKENGAPPSDLRLLKPKYIQMLPTSTGMGGYPEYKYQLLNDEIPRGSYRFLAPPA